MEYLVKISKKARMLELKRRNLKIIVLTSYTPYPSRKINEGDGKITTCKELVEKFFCKFYPLSRDGKDEMLKEGDNSELDPLKFISQVNSIFKTHRRVDGTTKKALLHSWINENWNKEPTNDIVSINEEWEESDYGNSPNITTDSSFKPDLNA
nr:hypothetical protein [Tanacetum cinerariifolium]